MNKRLVQIMVHGCIEELWYFPSYVTDDEIQVLYKNYNESSYDSFEDYIESCGEFAALAERVYVDEIYID